MAFTKLSAVPTECPDCGGELWDNRKGKESGKYNRKRPDFSCKDRDGCNWGGFLEAKAAPAAAAAPRVAFRSWAELGLTFQRCVQVVDKVIGDYPPEAKVRAANGLLIAADRAGLVVKPPAKPKPAPPPEPEPEPEPDETDDGLPF